MLSHRQREIAEAEAALKARGVARWPKGSIGIKGWVLLWYMGGLLCETWCMRSMICGTCGTWAVQDGLNNFSTN